MEGRFRVLVRFRVKVLPLRGVLDEARVEERWEVSLGAMLRIGFYMNYLFLCVLPRLRRPFFAFSNDFI